MRHELKLGTVTGTLMSTLPQIGPDELLKTITLAALGATVSFLVSALLRWLRKR